MTDAREDGFDSIAGLLKMVERIYPNFASDGKQWFRVGFKLSDDAKKADRPAKRSGKLGREARRRLAAAIRGELDKAVRLNGSLAVL